MTIYYLQKSDTRVIIDTKVHEGFIAQESTEATSWIAAKLQFGYPLSSLQEASILE